jgi:hypothetical protein
MESEEGSAKPLELPVSVIDFLKKLIDELPEAPFLEFVRGRDELLKGSFKPSRKNIHVFRERVKGRAAMYFEDSREFRSLIHRSDLGRSFVSVLSADAIESAFHHLAAYFGRARLMAALLADDRGEVRGIGEERLEDVGRETGEGPETVSVAAAELRNLFAPFIRQLAPVFETNEESEESAEGIDLEQGKVRQLQAVDSLDRENDRLKRELDRKDLQIAKLERSETALRDRLNAETEAKEAALRDLKRERLEAATLREAVEREVREQCRKEADAEMRYWLDPIRSIEEEAKSRKAGGMQDDLLERVGVALRRQQERDRHFGNIATLNDRLDNLLKASRAVETARSQALHPLAELDEVKRNVEAEIGRIRGLLGIESGVDKVVTALQAYINGRTSPDLLRGAATLIDRLVAIGALGRKQTEDLYSFYHRKMARLYGEFEGTQESQTSSSLRGPAGKLQKALDTDASFLLVIDGYNLLMGLEGGYTGENGEEAIGQARERLVNLIVELVGPSPGCETWIHFDGPEHSEVGVSENLRIVYSGGTGENRADKRILDYLGFRLGGTESLPAALVTNDKALADRARRLGATIIAVRDFESLLSGVQRFDPNSS